MIVQRAVARLAGSLSCTIRRLKFDCAGQFDLTCLTILENVELRPKGFRVMKTLCVFVAVNQDGTRHLHRLVHIEQLSEDWIGAGSHDQISVDIMRQCRYALCRIAGQQRALQIGTCLCFPALVPDRPVGEKSMISSAVGTINSATVWGGPPNPVSI